MTALPGPPTQAAALPPVGSAARIRRSRHLKPYNRLLWLACLGNLAAAVVLLSTDDLTADTAFTAAGINIAVAALVRQQLVINALFWLATRAKTHLPLRVRWGLGKIYSFGGVHVGAAISASCWYVMFCVLTIHAGEDAFLIATMLAATVILVGMLVTSLPRMRAGHHNVFELVHRFGGWSLLAVIWAQTIALTLAEGGGSLSVASSPAVWLLAVTTLSIAAPWLRLRRVPVRVVKPSDHVAIAEFDYGVTPFAGSSTAVSRHPLREWHSFANVPSPGRSGFRLTISRAGDWTGDFIDDQPQHVWVKGIPTAGVGNIDQLFRSVLWVATGSGIGPCLPHLLAKTAPARLLWSTRTPERTYGEELVAEIREAIPSAVIWDTTERGKPDLLQLAYDEALAHGVEAVICISNQPTTWTIVEGLEQRGIPAFGAIWDS
ncbi:hypothetical protein [Microbacterium oxydans]|uniref:hypothetical protein n=1 Tax=Microbacterium oxydans TaxID=82380 RepID=UPI00226B1AE1|nr:hypothetical protein [Microbacterium oxydans]WAA65628.1 hypothetical protein MME74_15555 [Microbacterium oxydans]